MNKRENIIESINTSSTSLGFELGSTRIKAVLLSSDYSPIAAGSSTWENKLENGVWTYSLDDVWKGLQKAFLELKNEVKSKYQIELTSLGAVGVSAMMHGYLVFDKEDNLLVPFRTWRNTMTEEASSILTKTFNFNIPQRWNIAHLYQAILNKENHIDKIDFFTTLAGYVHWQLTGEKVLGVGDASGVFPIDSANNNYDEKMIDEFSHLISKEHPSLSLYNILPKVLNAGESGGVLSEKGALLLDPSGGLQGKIPFCPPEGDAGTGMVATNSVAKQTGNVSAGTSIFAMLVLENNLSKVYTEIDMVTTPDGKPVAMVHCNNCSSDLDAWINLFSQVSESLGGSTNKDDLYNNLYKKALEADEDCGEILSYNYFSGEPITKFEEGRPLLVRTPNSNFTLPNLMRSLIFSAFATLKIGVDILTKQEHVELEQILGHGGLFKTPKVAQRLMAAALNIPVSTMTSAGEGGAWGIALLAAYIKDKAADETLDNFLKDKVFVRNDLSRINPENKDVKSFEKFIEMYKNGFEIERAAINHFNKQKEC